MPSRQRSASPRPPRPRHLVTGGAGLIGSHLVDEPRAIGDVFNVGSSEEISIGQLARRVIEATSSSSAVELVPYEVAYEAGFEDMARRVPDVSKVASLTGWQAKAGLSEILADVVGEVLGGAGA